MILTQHPSSRNNKGARVAGAIKQDRAYLSTSVFDESYAVKSEEECSLIYEAIKSNPLFKSYDEAELRYKGLEEDLKRAKLEEDYSIRNTSGYE